MKKVFITIALLSIVTSFASLNIKELPKNNNNTELRYVDVNTFCKLIREGNYDAVKLMIEKGENINRASTGLTPLMFAARYNRAKIVQLLIDNGAKLNTKSTKRGGHTALKWAELAKADEAIKIIKKAMKK